MAAVNTLYLYDWLYNSFLNFFKMVHVLEISETRPSKWHIPFQIDHRAG